ncbi:MAG: hypothetical protein KAQ85_10920, partial [Thermodesulfovibrionia bacterium]|nr:hypothetical protein [Thermodesulfovibrionia bacterium]
MIKDLKALGQLKKDFYFKKREASLAGLYKLHSSAQKTSEVADIAVSIPRDYDLISDELWEEYLKDVEKLRGVRISWEKKDSAEKHIKGEMEDDELDISGVDSSGVDSLMEYRSPVTGKKDKKLERYVRGLIIKAYDESNTEEEIVLDITGYMGEAVIKTGRCKMSFPLPGGKSWGKDRGYLKIGKSATHLSFAVRKKEGKVKVVTFIGYREDARGNKYEIGRSDWCWTGKEFQYIRHSTEEEIKDLYNPLNNFEENSLDITEYMGSAGLKYPRSKESFPLPNGKTWGRGEALKVGATDILRLKFIVRKERGEVKTVAFVGYKKDILGNEYETGRSQWLWTGEKFQYMWPSEEDAIRKLYDKINDFEEKTIGITKYMGKAALNKGCSRQPFPLPNGSTWGVAESLRVGVNLFRLEFVVNKEDGEVESVVFIGYKKDSQGIEYENARSEW